MIRRFLRPISLAFALGALAVLGAAAPGRAAGTLPFALQTQFDNSGNLLSGCYLYFYVAGTVATPQQVYQDFGLTQAAPNPLECSAGGRLGMFWLADGLIHVRLTDSTGVVVVDATLQTLGPSSGGGGGGGGGTVDPTSVASTGDIKYRLTSEVLSGWVILNGQTIGSAISGASQRANADTQNLFIYLWTNCNNFHCPVPGGRGATALADFNANKQMTLPNMQDATPVGRDCMGSTCAGILLASNITSGNGDGVDTPLASGGVPNQTATTTITQANLPSLNFAVTIPAGQGAHAHTISPTAAQTNNTVAFSSGGGLNGSSPGASSVVAATLPAMSGTAASGGSGTQATTSPFATMPPFVLTTWYIKL